MDRLTNRRTPMLYLRRAKHFAVARKNVITYFPLLAISRWNLHWYKYCQIQAFKTNIETKEGRLCRFLSPCIRAVW